MDKYSTGFQGFWNSSSKLLAVGYGCKDLDKYSNRLLGYSMLRLRDLNKYSCIVQGCSRIRMQETLISNQADSKDNKKTLRTYKGRLKTSQDAKMSLGYARIS